MKIFGSEFTPPISFSAEVPEKKENPTEKVRKFFRSLFQDVYMGNTENFLSGAGFPSSNLESKIAQLVGTQKEWEEEGKITPQFREAVQIFFSEFLVFLKEKKKEDPEGAQKFVMELHDLFFRQSPSLVNYIDFATSLEFVAKTTRIPEAQAFVGANMVGEMVYNLSFAHDESIHVIEKKFFAASPAEQLDFLRTIETLGIDARSGDWSLPALHRLIRIAEDVVRDTQVPFVRLSAQAVLEHLNAELSDPTGSLVHQTGDRRNGSADTLPPEVRARSAFLRKNVLLDVPLTRQDSLVQIAKGYIGIVDQSGMLHSVGAVETQKFTEGEGPDFQDIDEGIQFLKERGKMFSIRNIAQMVAFVEQRILSQVQGYEYVQGEFWGRVGGISRETYEELFELDHIISDGETIYREQAPEKLSEEYEREKEIYSELLSQKEVFISHLLFELEQIRARYEHTRVPVHMQNPEDLVIERKQKAGTEEEEILLFQHMHHPRIRTLIEKEFKFSYNDISLHSQKELLQFLSQKDDGALQSLKEVLGQKEIDHVSVLEAFLACRADKQSGDTIVELLSLLSAKDIGKIFGAYHSVASQIEGSIEKFKQVQEGPLPFSDDVIYNGLLYRAKDILSTVAGRIKSGEPAGHVVDSTLEALQQEQPQEQILSGQFRRLVEALKERPKNSLDIEDFFLDSSQNFRDTERLYLRALHERGELSPIPEIHWRVDRGSEEYKRRFGFSLNELLQRLAGVEKKVLLEFGPGSGKSKAEREAAGIDEQYIDVALADKVYYPLGEYIFRSVDWDKLQSALPEGMKLKDEQKKLFSDALYKIVMIADGETSRDDFAYAQDRIEELTRDPGNLKEILQKLSAQIRDVLVVPSTISTRDDEGNVRYPYKLSLTEQNLVVAKAVFAENVKSFLKSGDVFEHIPAHPRGMMVGDFGEIEKLKDNQVDVACGVRSTVYKRGEEYMDFILTVMDKLKSGGIYIDDNIRDNDGWYYRLGEMMHVLRTLEVQKQKGLTDYDVTVHMVVGPGFSGEDFSQGEVPLAIVMGKNEDYSRLVQELLDTKNGFRLVSLGEYVKNTEVIRSLDETGYTLEVLEAELDSPPPVAADVFAA